MPWSSDFSYAYFKKLINTIKSNFEICLFSNILTKLTRPNNKIILRHDIDLDLDIALKMAEIENHLQIRSTYMVMINCPLYSIKNKKSKQMLFKIISLGHEIGLHFNFDKNNHQTNHSPALIKSKILSACKQLENTIHSPIESISFHRPLPRFINGPITIAGKTNAYSKKLMSWYLSDSGGNWREGEPLPKLLHPSNTLLQLLIHPIWWGNKHLIPSKKLQTYLEAKTQNQSLKYTRTIDIALTNHLTIQRSNK